MWVLLIAAGLVYARMGGVGNRIAIPIIAAFVIEAPLYLAPFFESARRAAARLGTLGLCGVLAADPSYPT